MRTEARIRSRSVSLQREWTPRMIQDYRCERCNHILFMGSLKPLLAKHHDPDKEYIKPKCPKCGLINRFAYNPSETVFKTRT